MTKHGIRALSIVLMTCLSGCDGDPLISPFIVGQMLCGNMHPYTCPPTNATPWGIVIYSDPDPSTTGYYGLAMSTQDVVRGFNGSGAGTAWATASIQNTDIGANNYGIYGGINGTFKDTQGNSQNGNTKTYCAYSGNDCSVPTSAPTTSAFNACVNYSNGPALAGGWYLPSVSELEQMYLFAQAQALPLATTGVQTFNSYWYWGSTEDKGATNASNLGNLGFTASSGTPSRAFYFGFFDGTQDTDVKTSVNEGVRCVQALPI